MGINMITVYEARHVNYEMPIPSFKIYGCVTLN